MAVHKVLTWGDPRLKINSSDVGDWTPELDQLVADLFETRPRRRTAWASPRRRWV